MHNLLYNENTNLSIFVKQKGEIKKLKTQKRDATPNIDFIMQTKKQNRFILKKGVDTVMTGRRKAGYEEVLLEILVIKEEDVIATSGPDNTEHVDKSTDSWVTPGTGSEWG